MTTKTVSPPNKPSKKYVVKLLLFTIGLMLLAYLAIYGSLTNGIYPTGYYYEDQSGSGSVTIHNGFSSEKIELVGGEEGALQAVAAIQDLRANWRITILFTLALICFALVPLFDKQKRKSGKIGRYYFILGVVVILFLIYQVVTYVNLIPEVNNTIETLKSRQP